MKKSLLIMFVLVAMVLIAGCSQKAPEETQNEGNKKVTGFILGEENHEEKKDPVVIDKDYCESDDDCACGMSLETAECEIGNRDYIKNGNDYKQDGGLCKSECNGFLGQMNLKCVDNACQVA